MRVSACVDLTSRCSSAGPARAGRAGICVGLGSRFAWEFWLAFAIKKVIISFSRGVRLFSEGHLPLAGNEQRAIHFR